MVITTKSVISIVFSVMFIISYVHCDTTTASAPDVAGPAYAAGPDAANKDYECFRTPACFAPGQWAIGCIVYCKEARYANYECVGEQCCCYHRDK